VLGKEPALVELILAESREVLRAERGVLITETHQGFVCANAGIDSSNLEEPGTVSLLPEDPDASARRIRAEIAEAGGEGVAVLYGGSVSSSNIDEFMAEPAIDGALVGGASLKPDEMAAIVARAGLTAAGRGATGA